MCGNEAGHTRAAEWSVVPARTADTEKIFESSQHIDDDEFRQRKISAWDADLGSRMILKDEKDLIWYPAEVNTSIRPGWFWHDYEDDKVKPLEYLIDVYNKSVGGNATFLLNIPPTNTGLFHENDVARLKELGDYLSNAFKTNILDNAKLSADSELCAHGIENARSDCYDCCYIAGEGQSRAVITAEWSEPVDIANVVLKENIYLSQRVESFRIEARINDKFVEVGKGTVIGHKRIVPIDSVRTDCLKIVIEDSRCEPTLSYIGVY